MSDSVDRVFAHALHTVKRIPRTGSARPPPEDRLKLYGLYKQSTEGDVEGVMSRPKGVGEDVPSDQEKWDAWNGHRGMSRTEAKRHYITTLIETMHRYASQTADARELVSELEFVWDQIKSNPPSTSSSNSHPYPSNTSPASRDRPIYPVMSEGGARNPGHARRKSLRAIDPVSQHSSEDAEDADYQQEEGQEEFVDAPDSQMDESPERAQEKQQPKKGPRDFGRQAGAVLAPIAKYLKSQKRAPDKPPETEDKRWQRRVESALIKMNAEMAALREQLEMQHEVMVHSSILGPFKSGRKQGVLGWFFGVVWGVLKTVVRHVVVDAAIVAAVTIWMHYNGIPADRLEQGIVKWVQRLRQIAFVRRIERLSARSDLRIPQAVQRSLPNVGVPRVRPDG